VTWKAAKQPFLLHCTQALEKDVRGREVAEVEFFAFLGGAASQEALGSLHI
jgi:hypothetical protein